MHAHMHTSNGATKLQSCNRKPLSGIAIDAAIYIKEHDAHGSSTTGAWLAIYISDRSRFKLMKHCILFVNPIR